VAHFYLDHNVKLNIASLLRAWGHDATAVREMGQPRAGDEEHLLLAAQRGWILVTHNRDDFRMLHRAWQLWSQAWGTTRSHAGILICPQTRSSERTVDELVRLASRGSPGANELWMWRSARGWVQEGWLGSLLPPPGSG
jgi:hypothetical protein